MSRSLKYLLTMVAATSLISACGDRDKDPLKNYDTVNLSVPLEHRKAQDSQEAMNSLYFIDIEGDLNFVQGEEGRVIFRPRLAFTNPQDVVYTLTMTEGPAHIGAQFKKGEGNYWVLSWKPGPHILTATENIKKFDLEIQFELDRTSSTLSKHQFQGHYNKNHYEIILTKDSSVPVIENNITINPGEALNPDQSAKVSFVAAAKGLGLNQNVQVNLYRWPAGPTREFIQLDAFAGKYENAVQTKKLGTDSLGRTRFEYEINFEARPFVDAVIREIYKSKLLKNRLQAGEITQAEAHFSIEVINPYNGMKSARSDILIYVNLNDEAGLPKLEGPHGNKIEIEAGAKLTDIFYIKSSGGRGAVSLQALELLEETVNFKDGKAKLELEGLSLDIKCLADKTISENETIQSCQIVVVRNCESDDQQLTLNIKAQSQLGQDIKEETLKYPIMLKGKTSLCAEVKSSEVKEGQES